MSCNLQNIFLWFLKVSWIAGMSKITFLNFYKSWNVLQSSKFFSMIFTSILDCLKLQNNFPKVTSPGMSCELQNIFLWFLKVSWIARLCKRTFLKFYKPCNILQASKYFSMLFKNIIDCQNVHDYLPEVLQVLECVARFKIFLYDF